MLKTRFISLIARLVYPLQGWVLRDFSLYDILCLRSLAYYTTKGRKKSMTIAELKLIIEDLMDDTVVLIEETDVNEVETVNIQIHSDGRVHLILSALE